MNDEKSVWGMTDFVITRTGLYYHVPGCRQLRGAKVQPYNEFDVDMVFRWDGARREETLVLPCKVCRPDIRVTAKDAQDDQKFERMMWSMLGSRAA
jgi:hypothetical protein